MTPSGPAAPLAARSIASSPSLPPAQAVCSRPGCESMSNAAVDAPSSAIPAPLRSRSSTTGSMPPSPLSNDPPSNQPPSNQPPSNQPPSKAPPNQPLSNPPSKNSPLKLPSKRSSLNKSPLASSTGMLGSWYPSPAKSMPRSA